MRVCVFGAGSLGSAIGGILAAKNDVILVGRDPHMSVTRKDGLRLTGDLRRTVFVDARDSVSGLNPPDLLIMTTKAFDTLEAVASCRHWSDASTKVLTVQNGLGNLEVLRAWKGVSAFGGTTTMGAQLLSPGKVRISGLGTTTIGADMDRSCAVEIAHRFAACGMPTRIEPNIRKEIWSKAAVSACINPLTAILRVPNGALAESDTLAGLVSEVCRECIRVAKSDGLNISVADVENRVIAVSRDTRRNRSSMLRDVECGRLTEVGQINGAIVSQGDRSGIPTPVNKALTSMVSAMACRATLCKD